MTHILAPDEVAHGEPPNLNQCWKLAIFTIFLFGALNIKNFPQTVWRQSLVAHLITDYKRTSLKTGVQVFEKFLSSLEKTWKGKLLEQSGKFTFD